MPMTRPKRAATSRNYEEVSDAMSVDSELEEEEETVAQSSTLSKRKRTTEVPKVKTSPVKRAKTTSERKEAEAPPTSTDGFQMLPAAKGKQKQKHMILNLQVFVSMPLDILFAIFSHLSPKDLLCLARTSRVFRETLMTRKASTVWKTARERLGAPDCPAIISEPHWAALLFGKNCQTCGAQNVPYIDFPLLRRACKACKTKHLILKSKINKKTYPGFEPSILEILPTINKGTLHRNYYWEHDITWILRKMKEFNDNIRKRKPDANEVLEEFKRIRKETIASAATNNSRWSEWMWQHEQRNSLDKFDASENRARLIREKFKEIGYEDQDMNFISLHPAANRKAEFTERVWQKTRKELEPEVILHRNYRLEEPHAEVRKARRRIVDQLYDEYKRTLRPSSWMSLPRTLDICMLEPFAKHITADSSAEVTSDTFKEAIKLLPELLLKASEELKAKLRDLILTSSPKASRVSSSSATPDSADILDLARHVFRCNHCEDHLMGCESVIAHQCRDEKEGLDRQPQAYDSTKQISYSVTYSAVAAEVIAAAGLDPETALTKVLNDLDLRFGCLGCSQLLSSSLFHYGNPTVIARTWEDIIHHAASRRADVYHQAVKAVILSQKDTEEAKKKESNDYKWTLYKWSCAHCADYLNKLSSRAEIVLHVKETHNIDNPICGVDLLFLERRPMQFSTTIRAPKELIVEYVPFESKATPPTGTILCLRCSDSVSSLKWKLYEIPEVRAHLLSRHQVPSPQDGVDYRTK